MHNIITIFKNDLGHLHRSFWAMVVIVFCMLLPAMYAWVNIYANWDPYGNTAGVKIAVVSNDKDYTAEDGTVVNVGDEVLENLRSNTAIGWQFMDDTEAALDGVYDGSYYAAIIIDEDFTYNMYNFLTTDMTSPTIRYYVNSKTNAIAVKITDTAAEAVKSSVNENYLKVIIETVFAKINGLYQNIEAEDPISGLEDALSGISNNLHSYSNTLGAFTNAGNMLSNNLASMNETIDYAIYTINGSRDNLEQQVQDVNSAQNELANLNTEIDNSLSNISSLLQTAIDQVSGTGITQNGTTTPATMEQLEKQYKELIAYLETRGGETDPATADVMSSLNNNLTRLQELRKSLGLTNQFSSDDQAYLSSVSTAQALTSIKSDFDGTVVPGIYKAYVDPSANAILAANSASASTLQSMSEFMLADVNKKLDSIDKNLDLINDPDPAVAQAAAARAGSDASSAAGELDTLSMTYTLLAKQVSGVDASALAASSAHASNQLSGISSSLSSLKLVDLKTMLEANKIAVDAVRSAMVDNVYPAMNTTLDSIKSTMGDMSSVLMNLGDTLQSTKPVIASMDNAVTSLNNAFYQMQNVMNSISGQLDDLLKKIDDLKNDEKIQTLLDFFGLDPDAIGEFLAQPVDTVTETVYPVENYGSGMTPFYTALAIWVGSVVLCAIISANASPIGLAGPKIWQLYFGRYLTFFFYAEIQSVVIVLGDLFLLGCQCLHPWLFILAGMVTAFSFSMLIFSLTLSFGDVGKAIVVVIMILQIAGSSGSFPIELLPEFFQKIYIFFPFPYAINAMRECIAGMYGMDYVKYLLELLVFAAAGLFIGLVIRKPFMGITEYIEEKAKDTEMM